ncbi:MAG: aminoacyl-tRNA hydrolase [Candidatus Portnoybacteria bacterium]|nr:aminoacyl-tRNA hydrolase [Candidatus Portnoybacteria bacterium]
MKLIIGLGNPGSKYEKTRHNLGFMAADFLRDNLDNFSQWREQKANNALIAEGEISDEKIILAKPQTFMNLSGQPVQKIAYFYKIKPEDIWIIHDEFDLPLGLLRVSKGASAGGHNGIKSIIETLGAQNFIRFRLGIHPIGKEPPASILNKILFKDLEKKAPLEKFVLEKFEKDETKFVEEIIRKNLLAVETAIKEGIEKAMNQFN